ncbi:MAG: hypothetical protein GQ551_12480 [Myxococcales bacterium]|jgi:hypothetical protein|nr:hypothetical protein [Myxococcales bacterium]
MTVQMQRSFLLTLALAAPLISGAIQLDDGSELRVEQIRGAAEYVEIIW